MLYKMMEGHEKLSKEYPINVSCIGIGANYRIAFNDSSVTDFNYPHLVRTVQLDKACRLQQLNEGWFSSMEEVPKKEIAPTTTVIMNSRAPGTRKAEAMYNSLYGPIDPSCPASILRVHPETTLCWTVLPLPRSMN